MNGKTDKSENNSGAAPKDPASDRSLFRNVFDSSPDALIVLDADGKIECANTVACLLLNRPESELVSQSFHECVTLTDINGKRALELPTFHEIGRMRHMFFIPRARLMIGSTFVGLVEVEAFPLRRSPDQPPYAVLVSLWAPNALFKLNAPMFYKWRFHAVAQLAQSFVEEVGKWAAATVGHLHSVGDNLLPGSFMHGQNLGLQESTKRALTMTEQLRTLLSISGQHALSNLAPTDLRPVLRDAAEQALAGIHTPDIRLRISPIRARYAIARADDLRACVQSIIRNAIEALNGKGEVRIDTSESTVRGERYAVIRIRDNGQGISTETAEHLFEPFFTTKEDATHSGLGLTLAQAVVQGWGGHIRFRSRPNVGSSFRIFLPSAQAPAKAPKQQQRTALIVDDDAGELSEVAQQIRLLGYLPLSFTTADEALRRLQSHEKAPPALILLDTILPNRGCERLVEHLTTLKTPPPLILISGFSRDFARNIAGSLSWRFIQKPIDKEHLAQAIEKLLGNSVENSSST